MKQSTIKELLLYRYRYILGALLAVSLLVALLIIELTTVPGGLKASEIRSAISSGQVGVTLQNNIIDLPYHALQALSIKLLGLSELAIKLPSVVLGFIAGIGIFILLRRWFRTNVASIAAFFAVTNGLFLVAGRSGDPSIMPVLWSVMLLLFATLITQDARGQFVWRSVLGAIVGLSLYTPLTAYVIVAALMAGVLHPHVRYVLRRYGRTETALAGFLFALAVAPLTYGLYQDPTLALRLLGIPSELPTLGAYVSNVAELLTQLAGFWRPMITDTIQPVFSVATLVLIILGLGRILAEHHATRTYALLFWLAIIVPVVILQPESSSVLFVPAVLLIAVGLQVLIKYWYTLFPRNPYARLLGLLPLIALVGGITYLNYVTYFNGFRYSPAAAELHDESLGLLTRELASDRLNVGRITIIVPNDRVQFYDDIAKKTGNCVGNICIKARTDDIAELVAQKGSVIISDDVAVRAAQPPSALLVSDEKDDALYWRVYTRW